MKDVLKSLAIILLFCNIYTINAQNDPAEKKYFQISTRIGYDFPTYNNNTPYIDYKGGLEIGASLDYYWNWIGLGLDFDYIKNNPKSTYPTSFIGTTATEYLLSEDNITRTFIGLGPSFKYQNNSGKFTVELNLRGGISSIRGGRTLLEYTPTGSIASTMLNFHAGYDEKSIFSAKAQIRFTYFLNSNWGINTGAYYLKHFNVTELSEGGISAGFLPFTEDAGGLLMGSGSPLLRTEACTHDIYSIGVFVGITYKFSKKNKACSVCGTVHYPSCCSTCGCGITVTAKDKYTGEVLPNTDIILEDLEGNIKQTGTTNSYGVAVFSDVDPNNYLVNGKLNNIILEETSITKSEFKDCLKDGSTIQKEILYSDLNFILKGNVVECNTVTGIQGVDIILKDKIKAGQKNTLSDANGNFIFHLKQSSTHTLKGNKNGYFSNEVEVSTSQYNRNTTLFIDFEMCVDPCGKAIRLDNIQFDLAKWNILSASISDLQKVVKLMKDNPSIMVEMSSHTDSRGSHAYNQDLSQKRAQSTVDYLVSQGVSRSRLIARGAGETELLNRCADNVQCSETEHRINRRTEFKVVCPQ